MVVRRSLGEKIFDLFNYIFMFLIIIIMLYPILYVIFASFSNPMLVRTRGGILLWPVEPTIQGYSIIFHGKDVWTGYKNTIFYVVVGTSFNILMTAMAAYVLSRKGLMLNRFFMFMIVVTMYFSGGLIPTYFVVRNLGLINSRFALILPSAIATWNLIIMRTYFMGIPAELEQAAKIDGANDMYVLWKIILPLSVPIIAVMILFYGVGHWNSWFPAVLYLREREKYPLQLFLREILVLGNTVVDDTKQISTTAMDTMLTKLLIKYSITVVATVPILVIYPFLQKYFIKGIMIGSLKG